MDGLSDHFRLDDLAPQRRTLRQPIGCVGVGLHSGRRIAMTLCPAAPGSGIRFHRKDVGVSIPARYDHVIDTRLCTVLGLPHDPAMRVGTVEHVMAALSGCGITDAVVEIDGPEVPALDGSARELVFLIDCAGVVETDGPAPVLQVLRPVRVEHGGGFAELRPLGPGAGLALDLAMAIGFDAPAIGHQALSMRLSPRGFRAELAGARTFALAGDVAALHAAGLAKGGSLDNTVVVDGAAVLNPLGLRRPDEFVRHKMLDAVGDLALAGSAIAGRFIGHRSGHALNNRLLHALFADVANWRMIDMTRSTAASDWHVRQLADAAD